jgi:uncharacterized tellurite resistance protein B-like protein
MSSIQQLKLLINLARADGDFDEKERQYIINIGQANHLLVAEILPLFSVEQDQIIPLDLTPEEKFDYIFSLIQLMKIDEKIYQNEIQYCARVASALGYRREVLVDLMLKIKTVSMEKGEMDSLKKLTATYLLHS